MLVFVAEFLRLAYRRDGEVGELESPMAVVAAASAPATRRGIACPSASPHDTVERKRSNATLKLISQKICIWSPRTLNIL